jgi:hypothetical protein
VLRVPNRAARESEDRGRACPGQVKTARASRKCCAVARSNPRSQTNPFRTSRLWYSGEKSISKPEKGKRAAAILVGEKLGREIRRGGRTNLIVDLDVPDLPEHTVWVVAAHLENRTDPKDRRLELEELMGKVRHSQMPVIIAGDMNTTGANSRARSTLETVKDKFGSTEYAAQTALKYATGIGIYQSVWIGYSSRLTTKTHETRKGPTVSPRTLRAHSPPSTTLLQNAFRTTIRSC